MDYLQYMERKEVLNHLNPGITTEGTALIIKLLCDIRDELHYMNEFARKYEEEHQDCG